MIDGVLIVPLKQLPDERGMVMHMLRKDADHFESFGEVYFSKVNPGKVKAWRKHTVMTQNFTVPVGSVELVMYDGRKAASTSGSLMMIQVGVESYQLVKIPPGVWYGFKGCEQEGGLVVNCATQLYDVDEVERLDPDTTLIPHKW